MFLRLQPGKPPYLSKREARMSQCLRLGVVDGAAVAAGAGAIRVGIRGIGVAAVGAEAADRAV